jgi:integrase/recombinase XerD
MAGRLRFLQRRPELSGLSLNELGERWVEEQPSPSRLFDARKAGRVVSKAMHRVDPRVPVLPIGDGVARAARQHHRSAHLYTDEEVQRILQAALAYPSPKAPWRPIWLFTMLMLAYCAGLRGGEIARLKLGDIDLRERTIEIRETKFFKYAVPIAMSMWRTGKCAHAGKWAARRRYRPRWIGIVYRHRLARNVVSLLPGR